MNSYQFTVIEKSESNIRFSIEKSTGLISHQWFLERLKEEFEFRKQYNDYLANCGFEAFFWENKPISISNLDEDYECNLINSDFLASCSPDSKAFQSYFNKNESVISFPNLGNDAQLVVPCPIKKHPVYTHIGNFVREADASQKNAFWEQIGEEALKEIGEKPKWLSTSGLGVFWLHARIDSYPKYYHTSEYKTL